MSIPTPIVALAYVLNVVLVAILFRGASRGALGPRSRRLSLAALGLVVVADLTFLTWVDCHPRALLGVLTAVSIGTALGQESRLGDIHAAMGASRFPIYILAIGTLALISHVHLPITTLLTSPGEIEIHLDYLLATHARHAMAIVYVAALVYALAFSPRLKAWLTLLALTGLGLGLVYAYAYPFGYPVMNGLLFEQIPLTSGELAGRAVVDAATVFAAFLGAEWLLCRYGGRRIVVGIVLLNASLGLASLVVARRNLGQGGAGDTVASTETARPLRFARGERNVLIVMLDRFMGGFVEGIVEAEPELRRQLDGFTWYPRTVSPGENSIAGIHAVLGGYDYTPREMNARRQRLRDLSVESFAILPRNFTAKGMEVSLVNPRGLGFTMAGDCSYLGDIEGLTCAHIPSTLSKRRAKEVGLPLGVLAKSNYADLLALLGLMRVAPYGLRAVLQVKGPWKPFLDHSAGTTFREWAELEAWPDLSLVTEGPGRLNVIFNILPHEPYFMGEDCFPRPTQVKPPPEELRRRGYRSLFEYQHYVAARCTLKLVGRYLDWMRSAGVYDDTKIVLVSDHGIVGPVEDRSSRAQAGGTTANAFVRTRSLLLVKPRGATGELQISEEYLPNAEVPRIACEEIGGCVNPYLEQRTIEAHGRDVPFFVSIVPWQFNLQAIDGFKIERELVLISRDPYDRRAWREVGAAPSP